MLRIPTAVRDDSPNGKRVRQSAGTKIKPDAEAYLAKLKLDAHREAPPVCFVFRGNPIKWELTNSAWHTAIAKASISDFRFHDLCHTWASWHRQAGTSCDELKELGGWKLREMVDRYAKYATTHLVAAAMRI